MKVVRIADAIKAHCMSRKAKVQHQHKLLGPDNLTRSSEQEWSFMCAWRALCIVTSN